MDCEQCRERPARYCVTRVINGETVAEVHLCERCAAEHGEVPAGPGPAAETAFSIQQFLASLLGAEAVAGSTQARQDPEQAEALCARCGHTYREFARTGLLGCPECYTAFSAQLQPLIGRIQGSVHHEGKWPTRGATQARRQRDLARLRRELQEAIRQEEFERAAVLRDGIRQAERRVESPRGSAAAADPGEADGAQPVRPPAGPGGGAS